MACGRHKETSNEICSLMAELKQFLLPSILKIEYD